MLPDPSLFLAKTRLHFLKLILGVKARWEGREKGGGGVTRGVEGRGGTRGVEGMGGPPNCLPIDHI